MRKISEVLTLSRKYHAPSNGIALWGGDSRLTDKDNPTYWGMCRAVESAYLNKEITQDEYNAATNHILGKVLGRRVGMFLSELLGTDCPTTLSRWWDDHIEDLTERGL